MSLNPVIRCHACSRNYVAYNHVRDCPFCHGSPQVVEPVRIKPIPEPTFLISDVPSATVIDLTPDVDPFGADDGLTGEF